MTRTTEYLIRNLAARPAPRGLGPMHAAMTILAAVICALALFFGVIGMRPGLLLAMTDPMVPAKILLPLALAVPALVLALRSARPGTSLRFWPLAVPATMALALFMTRLLQTPSGAVTPGLMGSSAAQCLISITLLSAPALILGLMLFRRGASVRPALTGGLIGLAVSASATTGYALHCNEDLPLFFVFWYGSAMLVCATAGAIAGRRLLRW